MAADEHVVRQSLVDPASFEALVPLHSPQLYAYLSRRVGTAADDLLAEVWLAAFASRSRYDPSLGAVLPWLFGIAHNTLMTHYRRYRRERSTELHDRGRSADPWAEVDARLDAAATRPALRAALGGLPVEERDVVLLVAWEQLTPTEAAGVLGIPAGTARSRLHRARRRLRERLSQQVQAIDRGGASHADP